MFNDIHFNFKLPFLTREDYVNGLKELGVRKDSIFISLRVLLRTQSHYFEAAYFGCKPGSNSEEIQRRLKRSTFGNAISELGIKFSIFDTQQMKLNAIKNHLIASDKKYIAIQKENQLKKNKEQKAFKKININDEQEDDYDLIEDHSDNPESDYASCLSCGSNFGCVYPGGN